MYIRPIYSVCLCVCDVFVWCFSLFVSNGFRAPSSVALTPVLYRKARSELSRESAHAPHEMFSSPFCRAPLTRSHARLAHP